MLILTQEYNMLLIKSFWILPKLESPVLSLCHSSTCGYNYLRAGGKEGRLYLLDTTGDKFEEITVSITLNLFSFDFLNMHIIMYHSKQSFNILPGQHYGHLNFWKICVQISPSRGQKAIQMPHHRSVSGH